MPSDEWYLPTRHIGRRVLCYEQIDSTNARAMELSDDPANDGLVLLADAQTAGRGQYGRTWLAPPRSSVLMSVLLFPPAPLRRPPLLAAWAAVSICTLIQRVAGLQARIKWPNDVLIQGRKTCGILIEQQSRSGVLTTVAGIGLNITQAQSHFDGAGLPAATSLFASAGRAFDTHVIARELIAILDEEYQAMLGGFIEPLQSRWLQHLDLHGKMVIASCTNGDSVGKLITLSFEDIEIELLNGERCHLRPEVVRHLQATQSSSTGMGRHCS